MWTRPALEMGYVVVRRFFNVFALYGLDQLLPKGILLMIRVFINYELSFCPKVRKLIIFSYFVFFGI